ncbi:MAG: hypothetical protein WBQ94_22465, partial [Terracidiphilus sp.]
SLPAGTGYAVGTAAYPQTSGEVFTGASDLLAGQELVLSAGSNLVTGSVPAFAASTAYLESSQWIGKVVSVNAASSSLSMDSLSGLFTGSRPAIQQMEVQAGASTAFVGFGSASVSAVNEGQFVAAKGPLFNTVSSIGYPTLSTIQLRERAAGN